MSETTSVQRQKSLGNVRPRTYHEVLEEEYRYTSTLSLTLALDGRGWSSPGPDNFIRGKRPGTDFTRDGWAPGLVWTGAENLALPRIRSTDRPARKESLTDYGVPAHSKISNMLIII
jgi:hypothetical protein